MRGELQDVTSTVNFSESDPFRKSYEYNTNGPRSIEGVKAIQVD